LDDPLLRLPGENGVDAVLGVLDVLLDEGDGEDLLALVALLARGGGDSAVEKRIVLLEDGSALSRLGASLAANAEVLLQRIESGSACRLEETSALLPASR